MFPTAGSHVYYNEAGEVLGWDAPDHDDAPDPDDYYGDEREDPNDVANMTIPSLVREFTDRKMAGVRGEVPTEEEHERHGVVVGELRRRGVLD